MSVRCLCTVVVVGYFMVPSSAGAEPPDPPLPSVSEPTFAVSLHHARATDAAQRISDITGKAFSVPSILTDVSVDMVCERKLTREQTYSVFLLSLAAKNIRISRAKTHIFMKESEGQDPTRLPDAEDIDAKIVATLTNNVRDGFLIYDIRPGSVFESAGLRNGDIAREANGRAFDWLAGPCALFEAVTSPKAVSLLIERKQRLSLALPAH